LIALEFDTPDQVLPYIILNRTNFDVMDNFVVAECVSPGIGKKGFERFSLFFYLRDSAK
jgi:hypothetical protein